VKASVCTDDDPFLQVHNIPPLCLDFELTGAAQCEREIDVGIRFDGDNSGELVTRRPINLVGDGTCVSLSGMSLLEESIEHVCGPAVDLCLGFVDDRGKNSLKLDLDSAAGCPLITFENCRRSTADGEIHVVHLLPLPCFLLGNECMQHTDCASCIGNGCGWCATGFSDEHACKAGSAEGPTCGQCGGKVCGCDWHFETCPVTTAVLRENEARLNITLDKLEHAQQLLNSTLNLVKSGNMIQLDPSEQPMDGFQCTSTRELQSELSAHIVVTTLLSVLAVFVGSALGIALGKAGFMSTLSGQLLAKITPFVRRPRDPEGPILF